MTDIPGLSRILHLNSAHVTAAAMDWLTGVGAEALPIAIYPSRNGVFIHVDDFNNLESDWPEDMPLSIDDVITAAECQGAKWLFLHEFGVTDPTLPIHQI
jgi:hypothetical protein